MRRTTPRTTLGRCSTRTAAPMRRNVSSSLKHTQQHNGTLVPARVPIPCPFGQVASMRNQQAQKGTAHYQTQRANARHRPTFQHTNSGTLPFTVVSKSVPHWSGSRRSKTNTSLFQFKCHQHKQLRAIPRAVNQLRNQLTWLVLGTRVHTSSRPVAARRHHAVCFSPTASSPAVGPRGTPCNDRVAFGCRYYSRFGRYAVPLALGRGTCSSSLASFR